MRTLNYLLTAVLSVVMLASCHKPEKPMVYASSTVTMRVNSDKSYFLKASDDLALVVCNSGLEKFPYKKLEEKRAIVTFGILDPDDINAPAIPKGAENFKEVAFVSLVQLDTMVISKPVTCDGDIDSKYGEDPIGVITDNRFPTTLVEDGYLNLTFAIPVNPYAPEVHHDINLVANPDDPYDFEVRHKSNGDDGPSNSLYVMSFSLKDLPSTEGKTVKLKLRWKGLSMVEETATFDFQSRTDW